MFLLVWLGLNLPSCYLFSIYSTCFFLFPLIFSSFFGLIIFMISFYCLYRLLGCTTSFVMCAIALGIITYIFDLSQSTFKWYYTSQQYIPFSPSWPLCYCSSSCTFIWIINPTINYYFRFNIQLYVLNIL